MRSRLAFRNVAPWGFKAVLGLERYLGESELEPALLDLVRLRASQINGCAYCLAMHARDLRAHGETERRLDVLAGWRDAPYFTEREQAALAWTEAVTQISPDGVPDDAYEQTLAQFGDKGLADLTLAVAAINTWNRLNIAFRNPPAA